MRQEWYEFEPGSWNTDINVRSFIQHNYTPYEGDDSFLEEPTEKTRKLWEKVIPNANVHAIKPMADG